MPNANILLIDDDDTNRKLIEILLSLEGHTILSTTDAEKALEILKNYRPDLILLDWKLPGMDGLSLTKKLKADPIYQNIQIVLLTAFAMKGDEAKALAAGCDGYIAKPIDTTTFPSLINTFLVHQKA